VQTTNLRGRRPPPDPASASSGPAPRAVRAVPRAVPAGAAGREPTHAPLLRRVVLTWLSTGCGGAERSVTELAGCLLRYGLDVTVVWWRTATASVPPDPADSLDVRQVSGAGRYAAALADALEAAPVPGAVVVSNHRTVLLDLQLCGRWSVPVLPVLRGLLIPGMALRVVDPDSLRLLARPTPRRRPAGLRRPRPAGVAAVDVAQLAQGAGRGLVPAGSAASSTAGPSGLGRAGGELAG
jgi:hypothetical protein